MFCYSYGKKRIFEDLLSIMIFLFAVTCKSGTAGDRKLIGGGAWLNIMTANSMECEGLVTAWEFYSKSTGEIYLGLWDYNPDGHTFNLTGKNLVTVGNADSGQSKVCVCVCACVCVCVRVCVCVCSWAFIHCK